MPPLWQYFARCKIRQTSSSLPPKDTDPRTARNFPCITALSERHGESHDRAFVNP
jgi:hypothetical protein